ncbi:MAG TPA: DUF948 domain-containing protein [Gemmatimonadaceae bacterium]|jgi:uncharacterized protein YoxC
MTLIAQMGALLLQSATTAGNTVATPVGSGPSWYVLFTQITTAASVVVFLVLMLILIPALVKFRKTAEKLDAVLDHIERNIEPVSKHATSIADNVDYISTSIRADVQELRRTLLSANTGIRDAIESSERRLHELGAVLRVVQEEAEQAFVSTASTIRGVRAGAERFRENGPRLPQRESLDDVEDLDDLDEEDFDEDEGRLEAYLEMAAIDDEDEDARESGIETINDLDAAVNAAEDITNGDDNGSALGRAKPRIKRTRRHDRE